MRRKRKIPLIFKLNFTRRTVENIIQCGLYRIADIFRFLFIRKLPNLTKHQNSKTKNKQKKKTERKKEKKKHIFLSNKNREGGKRKLLEQQQQNTIKIRIEKKNYNSL